MVRLNQDDIQELTRLFPNCVHLGLRLSEISMWKIGGCADLIIRPNSLKQVADLRFWFHQKKIAHLVIGHTSNLLFADEGLRVPCIQITSSLSGININGSTVEAESGCWVPGLAWKVMKAGLTGLEHVCGIPGTFGGLICMNGGSLRKNVGNSINEVISINIKGESIVRKAEDCCFLYRDSIFQKNNEIIVSAKLTLKESKVESIRKEMLKILDSRKKKFPRKFPNCGSVFKSNPKMYEDVGPPGLIIEKLGLKGLRAGGAVISPEHANFIINIGNAKAKDVLWLVNKARNDVRRATGFEMEAEIKYVSEKGVLFSADDARLLNSEY